MNEKYIKVGTQCIKQT